MDTLEHCLNLVKMHQTKVSLFSGSKIQHKFGTPCALHLYKRQNSVAFPSVCRPALSQLRERSRACRVKASGSEGSPVETGEDTKIKKTLSDLDALLGVQEEEEEKQKKDEVGHSLPETELYQFPEDLLRPVQRSCTASLP